MYHVMHELVKIAAGRVRHQKHGDRLVREAMASTTGECLTSGKATVDYGDGQVRVGPMAAHRGLDCMAM